MIYICTARDYAGVMMIDTARFQFPFVIAHRGAPLLAPENTLPALEAAIHSGAKYIETDIQLAATGEACLFHDDRLKRTTNGKGVFEKQPWSLLQQLDVGEWFDSQYRGVRVPLLSQWLQCAAAHSVGLNLEIKPTKQVEAVVDATLAMIDKHWRDDLPPLLISSKSQIILGQFAEQRPSLARAWVCPKWRYRCVHVLEQLACVSIHCDHRVLSAKRVKAVRSAGFQVLAFTVNDSDRADQLFDWGVSAIFSDNMDLVAQYD